MRSTAPEAHSQMLSTNQLRRRFYSDRASPFSIFNEEARLLARDNFTVLHAGCGKDDSIDFQHMAATTIGVDMDSWIQKNSDLDIAIVGNLSNLPLKSGPVDLIVSKWVLEHLARPAAFFQEAARTLRPGKHLLVLTLNIWHYAGTAIRISPYRLQKWFVKNALGGDTNEVFPTFYRTNSTRQIRDLATSAGLDEEKLELLEGDPKLLGFSSITYIAGIIYEKVVNNLGPLRGLRAVIIAFFSRPE